MAPQLLVHGWHGDGARDLACRVSTHSVGHDEEGELLVDEEIILVVIAHFAHVRCCIEADGVAERHAIRAIVPRGAAGRANVRFRPRPGRPSVRGRAPSCTDGYAPDRACAPQPTCDHHGGRAPAARSTARPLRPARAWARRGDKVPSLWPKPSPADSFSRRRSGWLRPG